MAPTRLTVRIGERDRQFEPHSDVISRALETMRITRERTKQDSNMPGRRQRESAGSHSDAVETDRRFHAIAGLVLNSRPSKAEKKGPRPVKGEAKSAKTATKKTRDGSGVIRAVRGNAQ
jgi:hypothetical protein